ncbi:MAG: hypothetical protein MR629_05930 [Helicobacter sp.]|nr:hypothetical protein [Helicobacter sp.]MCI7485323.1 hypothetical protein [Helicobacter sp.]MDD7567050.1 hypothetical protein [Helicobacter sp.]MDY5740756.1 hypothetical protein [Helicobacter sp.]
MKRCIFVGIFLSILNAEWIMFSDSKDTYIYNNQSGEIFIRYKMGEQNYKDVFVKMPRGMFPNEIQDSKTSQSIQLQLQQNTQVDKDLEQRKLEALKKSQEALNNALDF